MVSLNVGDCAARSPELPLCGDRTHGETSHQSSTAPQMKALGPCMAVHGVVPWYRPSLSGAPGGTGLSLPRAMSHRNQRCLPRIEPHDFC